MEEERKFGEFLSLARALRSAQTGFIKKLVYQLRNELDVGSIKHAAIDLIAAAQLVSATFTLLEAYRFEDSELEQTKKQVIEQLKVSVEILREIAKYTSLRIGQAVADEAPAISKEMILLQAKRNFGL